jgi:AraC family transcriptional regulator, regulatory protein of adaptative response / DNA-3-methyladenine glycosylase II
MAFLAARATPGVERVDADCYTRTITIGGQPGTLAVSPVAGDAALMLDVDLEGSRFPLAVVERVRRMFDVGADPAVIGEQLSTDSLLRRTLSAHAGIRTPGAWDAFELTVRAILGQQISVKAATTISGRIAARWGTAIDTAAGLTRLFPTVDQLADAPLEEAGLTTARAATVRALARSVRDGLVVFDGLSTLASLREIAGIGEWTAGYVAMRALTDPDAFLSGDLVLRRMAGDCSARELERRSEAWRPWRAYAVMLLWQAARDLDEQQKRTRHAQMDSRLHLHGRRRRSGSLASTAASAGNHPKY